MVQSFVALIFRYQDQRTMDAQEFRAHHLWNPNVVYDPFPKAFQQYRQTHLNIPNCISIYQGKSP